MSHPVVQIPLIHCQSQTGRARDLKFWENVRPTLCVTCHVSSVTCHLSLVMCHLSHVTCHLSHVIFFYYFFFYIFSYKKIYIYFILQKNCTILWRWSVEGLLSTGPTPSTLLYLTRPDLSETSKICWTKNKIMSVESQN